MSNKHLYDQWKLLQQIRSTETQKNAMRERIQKSIQNHSSKTRPLWFFPWKSMIATSLLVVIFGSFLFMIMQQSTQQQTSKNLTIDKKLFSWKLDDVYSKKSDENLALYRKNNPIQVGTVNEVTEEEMNNIINNKPMFVKQELEYFPYQTFMYIEHVKTMEVLLRYYFFIPMTNEKWIQFTFDYPMLEYAEIFRAMSTLEFKGKSPFIHNEQLYVTHGYGKMIFPVDLQPISISQSKEVYHWERASTVSYNQYLEQILAGNGNWQKVVENEFSNTFISGNGNEEITITLNGKEITYEFFYLNQDE